MTRRHAGQDFDPRHRIIGAVVVIGLAVVAIPILLSERPPAELHDLRAATLDGRAEAQPTNKVVVTPVPPPGTARPTRRASSPPAGEAPESPPESKPAAPAPVPAPASPPAAGWVVQVGTFSKAANAERLERKLRAGGERILTERIRLGSGEAVRLRVGPFTDRDAALEAQTRIREEVGLKGVVLAHP